MSKASGLDMNKLTSPWSWQGDALCRTSIPSGRSPVVASISNRAGVWEWSCFVWHSSYCLHQSEGQNATEDEARRDCDDALSTLGYILPSDKVAVMI